MKTRFLSVLFLALAIPVPAQAITITSSSKGIVVDEGDTGQFILKGPTLSFKKVGDPNSGDIKIKPSFTPAPDGLSGTIAYPGSPGDAKLGYKISTADKSVTFSYDDISPVPLSADFEMEFLVDQFLGGLYVIGDKPPTRLPIDVIKGEYFHDTTFSLAGRDGVGLTITTPKGGTAFGDNRKYNGYSYTWRHQHPLKATEKSLVLTFADFRITPPANCLKPDGPPAEGKWQPIVELTDDFEGNKLDTTKWNNHDPKWAGRTPSWFSPQNVRVKDGKLQLVAKLEEPPEEVRKKGFFHTYTVACVTSKTRVCYGYFEAKAKPMDVRICNAFWFYYNDRDHQSEIDVFEICGGRNQFDRTLFHTLHVFGTPEGRDKHWAKSTHFRAPQRLADAYHVYGLEWGKEEIKCYFDGLLFSRFPNTNWHEPLNMDFDNEVNIPWFGKPEPEGFPAVFNIEYIHSWKRLDGDSPTTLVAPPAAKAKP
jgi:beta-glucanase (GH16 family)